MENRDQLEQERSRGNLARHAYENFIQGFVNEKRELLFKAFGDVSVDDTDALKTIKLQLYAIDQLEVDIQTIIDTGKMASTSLDAE